MNDELARSALNAIVDALIPLQSLDRKRAVLGALHFLNEDWVPLPHKGESPGSLGPAGEKGDTNGPFPSAAHAWMAKNELVADEVEQVFAFDAGKINIIADLPGKSKRENTILIYILMGVGTYLQTGERRFSDEAAREACIQHNAYDLNNHSVTMKELKSELTGDKKEGLDHYSSRPQEGRCLSEENCRRGSMSDGAAGA